MKSKEEILEDHCHVIGSGDGLWNKYPLIYISILKAMEEHAQQQLTPSWVKASERLPEQNKRLNLKWMSEPNYGIYDSCGMFIVGELKEKYPIEEIEWLDEQPAEIAAQRDVATDNFVWTEQRVLEYAKAYKISSSRISINQFKNDYDSFFKDTA